MDPTDGGSGRGGDERFAWARINAYGVLLVGLCLLTGANLFSPDESEILQRTGDFPALYFAWTAGFVLSGLLLGWGFLKADRLPEVTGLVIINLSMLMQVGSTAYYLGWIDPLTASRIATALVVLSTSWMRASVLTTKHGLSVTIPPSGQTRKKNIEDQSSRTDGLFNNGEGGDR